KARQEAIDLMMARENILKPSSASPVTLPNREMALGTYYATSINETLPKLTDKVFSEEEAVLAFQSQKINLRQLIKAKIEAHGILETTVGRILFNRTLPESMRYVNETVNNTGIQNL